MRTTRENKREYKIHFYNTSPTADEWRNESAITDERLIDQWDKEQRRREEAGKQDEETQEQSSKDLSAQEDEETVANETMTGETPKIGSGKAESVAYITQNNSDEESARPENEHSMRAVNDTRSRTRKGNKASTSERPWKVMETRRKWKTCKITTCLLAC